jgi:glycosyltransferase involved in cell wall biosynthesis
VDPTAAAGEPARTVWVDVEDLFDYAIANPRPSGIQRLAFEIYRVLNRRLGPGVRFLRHDPLHTSFRIIPWEAVSALFGELASAGEPASAAIPAPGLPAATTRPGDSAPLRRRLITRQRLASVVHLLPTRVSIPLVRYRALQPQALRAFRDFIRALGTQAGDATAPRPRLPATSPDAASTADVPEMAAAPPPVATDPGAAAFSALVRPGDALLVLGAPWFHRDYGHLLATARKRHQLRVALLLYDLIPLRRPEWCDRRLVRQFASWFAGTITQCDELFAISRASAEDVMLYARQNAIALPGPVRPIPIGTGFGLAAAERGDARAFAAEVDTALLPARGSYVLFVSTIEARKNHILLFRIWRQLVDEMPAEDVPTLVFAGRVGWLTADLMQQLDNADYLDGKILVVRDPIDAELRVLYDGCLFTVFPSLFEGWGLPVTESLALGKPCVISSCTSLPEAGGSLARYFDPDNTAEAYRVIRETIEDRPGLAAWTERVRRDFRPVPWEATATAILDGISDRAAASDRGPGRLGGV